MHKLDDAAIATSAVQSSYAEEEEHRVASKAARLRRIEHRLYNAPEGLRVSDLARDCGVTRRTIYRDLEALESMGVPIWEDSGRFGINRATYLSTIRLNLNETVALYFAARLLAHHSDEHNPHTVSALDKLAAGMPAGTVAEHIARVADLVRERPVRTAYVRILEVLTLAWAEQRMVRLRYRAPNRELTERDVAPYFIEVSRSAPAAYVIGHDRLRAAIRTFKIERIETAELLDESYTVPTDFDPYAFLARAWGVMDETEVEVQVRFSARVAPQIRESLWHHSQRLTELANGGCELVMTIGGIREVLPWILGWGADAEVLAPPALCAEVQAHARRMVALYDGGQAS
ncbi:helix-turn-helix transcriptional regulator [Candidatus Chloroploca asiatica]|uniref:helix-turn-helix transcriptional regulator n=1 Tax=Candidatus Chloroploca asiatica TaxID=1506545 RepID=UPI000BE9EF74|nr:WYL domain-containing protein [Candidatus Chloroploca asiatica]